MRMTRVSVCVSLHLSYQENGHGYLYCVGEIEIVDVRVPGLNKRVGFHRRQPILAEVLSQVAHLAAEPFGHTFWKQSQPR